jgi:hypothetical protein
MKVGAVGAVSLRPLSRSELVEAIWVRSATPPAGRSLVTRRRTARGWLHREAQKKKA